MAEARFVPGSSWRRGADAGGDTDGPLAAEAEPAPPRLDATPPRLPVPPTSLVGRAADIDEVTALLAAAPVVTLAGSGGCGKTRLALAVGQRAITGGAFPEGVWFADLAPLADEALVAPVVASLFAVPDSSADVVAELAARLAECRLLLILDNCEHVIDAAAVLCERLTMACPDVRVLTTTRERLAIPGETTFPVGSLGAEAAAELFADRARAADARLALDEADAPHVAEICRRLDGMPLAIELAAARVAVLSPAEIAAGLSDHFALLGQGYRTALPRQRTLRATVDWSHELLDDAERAVLRRVSVFGGGFTLDAAKSVAADAAVPGRAVAELLERLAAKSLVVAGRSRFRLLEAIRQYAAEKLVDADEAAATRGRHTAWFAEAAEVLAGQAFGADGPAALDAFAADYDNYRAALEWAVSADGDAAVRLAHDVFIFWSWRGHAGEGLHWMERALAGAASSPIAAAATRRWAILAYSVGAVDQAVEICSRAVELARGADQGELARALSLLGAICMNRGRFAEAEPLLLEGLALARELDNEIWTADCLTHLGWWAARQARYDEARGRCDDLAGLNPNNQFNAARALEIRSYCDFEQGRYGDAAAGFTRLVEIGEGMGDPEFRAAAFEGLGAVAAAEGRNADAHGAYSDAVALTRDNPDVMLLGAWAGLGELAAREGRFDDAWPLLSRGVDVARQRDDAFMLAWALNRLGGALLAAAAADPGTSRARVPAAQDAYAEARSIGARCGMPWVLAMAADGLAVVACAEGRMEDAARLRADAALTRTAIGAPSPGRGLLSPLEHITAG